MSLRQKIILLIVPIIVLPMIVSGWLSYSQLKTTAIEKSKEQMETLLEQYALYADQFIHSAESNILLFSNNELLRRYMVTQSEEERYEVLQPLLMKQMSSYQIAYPDYYEFRLIFPDGFEDLRQVNRRIDNHTMMEADNPFIKTILDKREGIYSRIWRNQDNGELVLYVAIALILNDFSIEASTIPPKFRGFLVLTIDISDLIKQMQQSRLGTDGYIFTVNNQGEPQLYPSHLVDMPETGRISPEHMKLLEIGQEVKAIVGGVDLSSLPIIDTSFLGHQGYMKAVKIHDDFILAAWLPSEEINQNTRELGMLVIGITLFAVLVTVLLLFGSLNLFVLRPIEKLRNAANEIGRGILTTAIDINHNDEVGDLAKSFDDMRKNTLRSHAHLEKLVDERTIEVRHALQSAEKASKAKSNFLSRMSHELRTPLNAILGFSQLYTYDKNLTDHQKNNARQICGAGEHLLSLIDEVLDLSKIEAGRLELSLETISLSRALENCCVLTESLAKAHNVTIIFDKDQCEGLYVHADYIRIKQVFLNLMSNAVKYNQEHGKVSVYCIRTNDDSIRINVRDTGPGIPAVKMSQLFEPFNRLGAEYSNTEGTGIGLLITKQLVEFMGGQIGVDSKPGMGSTFWVEMKASDAVASDAGAEFKDEPLQHDDITLAVESDARILVAEDNETNQDVLRQQLTLLGYASDFAADGVDAFEKWRTGDYHLLMTDIHMPKMDGYELVKKIHKTRQFAENRIPIIAITADAMHGQAQRCLDAGMDDYVAKPVHIGDLQQTLRRWLSTVTATATATANNDDLATEAGDNTTYGANNIGTEDVIDRAMLERMVGDDPAMHQQLLRSFVRTTPGILEDIASASLQHECDRLVAHAHKLKSSAKSVGANEMAETCEALELAAIDVNWPVIETLVPVLDGLSKAVEHYLEKNFRRF